MRFGVLKLNLLLIRTFPKRLRALSCSLNLEPRYLAIESVLSESEQMNFRVGKWFSLWQPMGAWVLPRLELESTPPSVISLTWGLCSSQQKIVCWRDALLLFRDDSWSNATCLCGPPHCVACSSSTRVHFFLQISVLNSYRCSKPNQSKKHRRTRVQGWQQEN